MISLFKSQPHQDFCVTTGKSSPLRGPQTFQRHSRKGDPNTFWNSFISDGLWPLFSAGSWFLGKSQHILPTHPTETWIPSKKGLDKFPHWTCQCPEKEGHIRFTATPYFAGWGMTKGGTTLVYLIDQCHIMLTRSHRLCLGIREQNRSVDSNIQ